MRGLKQSTARNVLVFITLASDHLTGGPGLSLTITASKNGGAFAAITPTVTDRGNGWYSLALTTSHTDTLGDLALHITATGADVTPVLMEVTPVASLSVAAASGGVTLADGVAHGGIPGSSTATLALKNMRLSSPSGTEALVIENTGGGPAVQITAANNNTVNIFSSASGNALNLMSTDGAGIAAQGTMGILAYGNSGMVVTGSNGPGMQIEGTDGPGMLIHGNTDVAPYMAGLVVIGSDAADISLEGSGLLQGDLGGRVLGNTSTAFIDVGVEVAGGGSSMTTPMTESYAADGALMTAEQALHMIWAKVSQARITGTTLIATGLDGTTPVMSFTLTVDGGGNVTNSVRTL